MNSFLLLCDVFSFVFWKKLKTTKKTFPDFYVTLSPSYANSSYAIFFWAKLRVYLGVLLYFFLKGIKIRFGTFVQKTSSRENSKEVSLLFHWCRAEMYGIKTILKFRTLLLKITQPIIYNLLSNHSSRDLSHFYTPECKIILTQPLH